MLHSGENSADTERCGNYDRRADEVSPFGDADGWQGAEANIPEDTTTCRSDVRYNERTEEVQPLLFRSETLR